MRPKILLTHALPVAQGDLEQLDFDLIELPLEQVELTLSLKEREQIHGIICLLSDKINQGTLDLMPNLKVIANYAVGLDNIDVYECTKRRVMVCHTPDVLTQASANHAFALMLNGIRRIDEAARCARHGKWKGWGPFEFLGQAPQDLKLGIVGAGKIGQGLGELAFKAFGMEIFYYSRSPKTNFEAKLQARRVSLEGLLKKSDVISVHLPLTQATKGLIDKQKLLMTRPKAQFINTSRGEVVNQEDLCQVLKQGHFSYVGLDVTTPEPLEPDHELYQFERVTITPHIASAEKRTRQDMSWLCFQNVSQALCGDRPATLYNTQVFGDL